MQAYHLEDWAGVMTGQHTIPKTRLAASSSVPVYAPSPCVTGKNKATLAARQAAVYLSHQKSRDQMFACGPFDQATWTCHVA